MPAALAAHRFGTVLAVARRQTGISHARISAQCGIRPERVGVLSRGEVSVTRYEKVARIADAPRVPGRPAGLASRPWQVVKDRAGDGTRHEYGGRAGAALTETDGPRPDRAKWADRTEVQIVAGRRWTGFRRPLRAVPVPEKAPGRYDDAHARDKGIHPSWRARAYLTAGEPEEAAVVVDRAPKPSAGVSPARPCAHPAPALQRPDAHRAVGKVARVPGRAEASGV